MLYVNSKTDKLFDIALSPVYVADMRRAGHSPSVRLFEAAACGVPVISDRWPGLEELFVPGLEIFVADTAEDVLGILADTPEADRRALAARARARVLAAHTPAHRAAELEGYLRETAPTRARSEKGETTWPVCS